MPLRAPTRNGDAGGRLSDVSASSASYIAAVAALGARNARNERRAPSGFGGTLSAVRPAMHDESAPPDSSWTRDTPPELPIRTPRRSWFAVLIAISVLALLGASRAEALRRDVAGWEDLGAVPGALRRYRPQGMTLVGDDLVFSHHRHDTGSQLFRLRRDTLEVMASAEMPPEATHTGGLAWDGARLWAADYNANRLYELDLERTFLSGTAEVIASYSTGLSGTSALAWVTLDGAQYLAVSDYSVWRSSRTYLLRKARVSELGSRPLSELADVSYDNRGWSQGLAWDGTFLYEAVNGVARDHVWVIDVRPALRSAAPVRHLGKLDAPGSGVEDLATDGSSLWTSDERSFRFFRRAGLDAVRRRFAAR